ncbi:hypothetical protein LDO32_18825 [Luteimonas sp. Y-2-2-4F]|nr:hypothetical protein [Luteimonas sp. Y-2-2-4F]MCD9033770.1 hypothetical protein [Luteimonas sp. Y-2-2-4F]
MRLPALALLALAASPVAAADRAGCDRVEVEDIANRDGSRLRLERHGGCDEASVRAVVRYAPPGSDAFAVALEAPSPDPQEPVRAVRFIDLDADGVHEVEAIGSCGAGPNCAGAVYRLDRPAGVFRPFFEGGYAELTMIDGHVVEAGRASCCAWEYHAWPVEPGPPPRASGSMAFRVVVGETGREDGADCAFLHPDGDGGERTMLPPGEAWLRICELYGPDYRLAAPGG